MVWRCAVSTRDNRERPGARADREVGIEAGPYGNTKSEVIACEDDERGSDAYRCRRRGLLIWFGASALPSEGDATIVSYGGPWG